MRWSFFLAPHADELLSSFLVRAAHRHGLAPYRFCAYHFPGTPVWNRDIDRSASNAFLEAIASKARLPLERVVEMTLRSTEAKLGPGATDRTGPWINSIGIYHRLRRRSGLQYCPDCLAEHPVFYQSWRLSFVVMCHRHQMWLQDACPHCDMPLALHRQLLSPLFCHSCSRPLSTKRDDPRLSLSALAQAQARYEQALMHDRGKIGRQTVSAEDLFRGARVVANLVEPLRSHTANSSKVRRSSLELARVEDRARILLPLQDMLEQWPRDFSAAARERHLTQRSFMRWSLSPWLAAAVDGLPEGRARSSAVHSLRACLETSRRHGVEWRTARAELLWRAALR